MNGTMHSLSASITSALALKPSTVYILRVENTKTRRSWHIRRCFSEFCELREKVLALIDDEMATYLTSQEIDSTESSFNTNSTASTSSSISSYVNKHRHPPTSDRFAYVFKEFPPRKLFGSRSKRVIEARSLALNRFLQQALDVIEVVRQRQLVSICFSMMTHIETFLGCGAHREDAPLVAPSSSVSSRNDKSARREASPSAARRTSAAIALTPGFHHYPLVPTPAFTMTLSDHRYQSSTSRFNPSSSSEDEAAGSSDEEPRRFNNLDFTRQFYREFGRQEERSEIYGDDSDDEEMQMLKKTWSAMMESELQERKLHHTGSHFAMLESGKTPADTWARRIEIAGIRNAAEPMGASNSTCPIRKTSLPATHRTEQLLNRHRSNYRIPIQQYPTSA